MPTVATPARLHSEVVGDGPPLLLIAGLGYASWCWTGLREALSDAFTVITFDNRGTGRSDKPPGPYTMALLADDALRVLDEHGFDTAHVLGHSMGGYIAQTLASRAPDRVRSLVLVGTTDGGPDTVPVPEETMAAWAKAGSLTPEQYARQSMPHSFARGWTERNPQAFEAILARRLEYPTPRECWQAQYAACVPHIVEGFDVSGLTMPTLVLHGEDDRVVPLANGEKMARALPDARWVPLPEAGHLPYLEDPAGFAARVRAFLEEREAAA